MIDRTGERRRLLVRAFTVQLVGTCQMGHQHDALNLRQCRNARMRGTEAVHVQTEAMHAAVQLQPHRQRARAVERGQRFQLPRRTHGKPEVVLGHQRHIAGFEDALQQQDRSLECDEVLSKKTSTFLFCSFILLSNLCILLVIISVVVHAFMLQIHSKGNLST